LVGFRNISEAFIGRSPGQPSEQPARYLVNRDRKAKVVAPIAVDVNVPATQPLVSHSQLAHDSKRRHVFGSNANLDAMDSESRKTPIRDERNRGRSDSLSRAIL
jgi:hypothetical protein